MISTCEEAIKEAPGKKYPYLALYNGKKVYKPGDWFDGRPAKFVVLMTSPSCGMIVCVMEEGSCPHLSRVGRYSDCWSELLFTKFEGKIILESE